MVEIRYNDTKEFTFFNLIVEFALMSTKFIVCDEIFFYQIGKDNKNVQIY